MIRNQFSFAWKLMIPVFILLALFMLITTGVFHGWAANILWLIALILLLIAVIQCVFIYRTDVALSQLRDFARKAENNQLQTSDFHIPFPENELGDVAQHIIKLYKRLTETKEALYTEKEKMALQQEEKNSLKRQLTYQIAYELKAPVRCIQKDLETLAADRQMSHEKISPLLDECFRQSSHLHKLVNEISLLTHLDEPGDHFRKKTIDVSTIVKRVLDENAGRFKECEIRIHNELNRPLPISGNEGLIYTLFQHLLDNTIAHAGKGVDVWINCHQEDDQFYYFHFANNGKDIDPRHLSNLFARFYRTNMDYVNGQPAGTGLGLAIVKNTVLYHGGDIRAYNRKEGGLEFEFTLNNVIHE